MNAHFNMKRILAGAALSGGLAVAGVGRFCHQQKPPYYSPG